MSGEKEIRNKVEKQVFQKNLQTLKLLVTAEEFRDAAKLIVEQIGVAQHQLQKGEIKLFDYGILVSELNLSLLKKFHLPIHFRPALSNYLQTGEIKKSLVPDRNYFFKYRPSPLKLNRELKPLERVWEIHLITYTKLTTEELKAALRDLSREQNRYFPKTKLYKRIKVRKNIDRELAIETSASLRQRPRLQENLGTYLSTIKKQMERGKFPKEEFEKIKKSHRHTIERVRKGYTANDISNETGVSTDSVKQTVKRLRIERQNRFEI